MRKLVDFDRTAPFDKLALDSVAVSGTQTPSDEPLFLPSPDRYQKSKSLFPTTADVIVVGGGLVGLSTAVELANRGRRVSVICQSLQGNQTTNGLGIVLSYLPVTPSEVELAHGSDSPSVVQSADDAYRWTLDKLAMIDRRFPCRIAGHLICGHHSDSASDMKRLAEFEQQRKGKASFLSRQDVVSREIGSEKFNGALIVPDAAVVDPGKVHVGFHHVARMFEIPIFDATRVVRIGKLPRGGFELRTNHGRVRANDVIVCAGHETGKLLPALRTRIGVQRTITLATPSLDVEMQQRIAPTNRIMSTNTAQRTFWYLDPDRGRLLFSTPAISDDLELERERATGRLTEIYPELRQLAIDRAWFAEAPLLRDRLPRVGVSNGIGFAIKGDAHQLAYSSWLGHQASELVEAGSPHRGSTRPWANVDVPGGYQIGLVGNLITSASALLARDKAK